MGCITGKIQVPDFPVILNEKRDGSVLVCAAGGGQEIPLKSRLPSMPRPGKFQLEEHPVTVADEAVSDTAEEVEEKILPVLNLQTFPVYQEGGEGDIGMRLRDMLIPQLGEAMVGGDEEIVS